jgi:dTDP-4-dehydrorhamnose reductase
MDILIIGSTGMLGNTLKNYFTEEGYKVKTLDRSEIDLSDCNYNELEDKIIEKDCDIVINCAGLIKQRKGVTTGQFISVNSLLPHNLSDICEEQNMKFIHITTDCVFDGKSGFYDESSLHNAIDDYGKSKSLGEPKNATVIRSSIIGEEEKNKLSLFEWVKSNASKKINGYTNHTWNGVTCLQMGVFIKDVIDNNLFWSGVYHLHSNDITKYELVSIINEIYNFNIDITPIEAEKSIYRTLRTSKNLNLSKKIPHIYKQVEEMKKFHDKLRNRQLEEYYKNIL